MKRFLIAFVFIAVAVPASPLTAQVSVTTVPAGGVEQIRVMLAAPAALVSGEIVMSLDPAVFGNIIAANVFSASGDQAGSANIQGRTVDVRFASAAGGIGRLPGLPVLVVDVPVLSTVKAGTPSPVTFQPGAVPWQDSQGITYSVMPVAGSLTVGGVLWVQDVTPGGSPLPAGATVRIDGGGFSAGTTLAIDGVALSGTQFVSPQQINFSLAGPADLTGKRLILTNSDGSRIDYFSSLRATVVNAATSGPFVNLLPIVPSQTYAAAGLVGSYYPSTYAIAVQNQAAQAVSVIFESWALYYDQYHVFNTTITVPAGGVYIEPMSQIGGAQDDRSSVTALPSTPVRMIMVNTDGSGTFVGAATPVPTQVHLITVVPGQSIGQTLFATGFNSPLQVNWEVGTPAPAPITVAAVLDGFTTFSVASEGGSWLSVSPAQGTTCAYLLSSASACFASSDFVVTADPTKLAPGTYQGSITVTPNSGFQPVPTAIPVNLVVSPLPTLAIDQTYAQFATYSAGPAPNTVSLHLTSNGPPAPFSVQTSTQSGQNWLSVSPTQGTAPATLTVSANQALFRGASDTGTITISGPGNTLTVPVSFQVLTPVVTPASLQFSAQIGQNAPPAQFIAVPSQFGAFTVSAQTNDGGAWLLTSIQFGAQVSMNLAGLAAGVYQGTVTINSSAYAPAMVSVTLTVWSGAPPAVTVSPASITFIGPSGITIPPQTFHIATGNIPLPYALSASLGAGPLYWVYASQLNTGYPLNATAPTPTTVTLTPNTSVPGTYHGTVTVTAPAGSTNSATVSVTLVVLPPTGPPIAATMVSAASLSTGAVAPGEIVTIFGQNMGPFVPAGFMLGSNGKVATNLGGTQVLFDSMPAPVLYTSTTQINAIVPYEVAGQASTVVSVVWDGMPVTATAVPVAPAEPAVFTIASNGEGAGAVLNSDNSLNSSSAPAVRGSIVQIFATGAGVTMPAGITGGITSTDTEKPAQPVSVTIGGVNAQIVYAAAAPDAVSGLFQVNATVPQGIAPGPAVPLVLTVGTASSPAGVTIGVK